MSGASVLAHAFRYVSVVTDLHPELPFCISLTELPSLSGLAVLDTLDVQYCSSLAALPSLSNLSGLKMLNLKGCLSLGALPDLSARKQLKVLWLPEMLQPWEAGGRKAYDLHTAEPCGSAKGAAL